MIATPDSGGQLVPIGTIKPSPENDDLYRAICEDDPDLIALAESIRRYGLREPIVLTQDGYILSGHRRYAASKLAGLNEVSVRHEDVRRGDSNFVPLLREFNRQREKSLDERLREEIVSADKEDAYAELLSEREDAAQFDAETVELKDHRPRNPISKAKLQMLDAVMAIVDEMKPYWPLSDRQIHYQLLNDPPLRHSSKPESRYRNNQQSYKDLVDLLTRARLTGQIPMKAIADSTRPVTTWNAWANAGTFIRQQISDFGKGYYRDLQQSQPNHVEILVEKNTVEPLIRPIAMKYCLPLTSGRGFCSLPPRAAMANRFRRSGKQKLVIIVISDFDPDGESICETFARSLRDDFRISGVQCVKAALTYEQTQRQDMPPALPAKTSSSRYREFADHYGDDVFELEALDPEVLQELVDDAIRSVLDIDLYNDEVDLEEEDAQWLDTVRRRLIAAMGEINLDDDAD